MKFIPLLALFLLAAPTCQAAPDQPGPTAGSTFKATVSLFDKAPYAGYMNGGRTDKILDRFTNQNFWISLKLVYMPAKFDRETGRYKSTPKIQLLAFTDHETNQFIVWQPLSLADYDWSTLFALPDGRKAELSPTLLELGDLADLNLRIYNKDGELLLDETYSETNLTLPWLTLRDWGDVHNEATDGSRYYFIPQSYWNGTDYTHGFVVGGGDTVWNTDFVEVCRGPIEACGPTREVSSIATGLKFIPAGKAKWTVRNMSASELREALKAELGLN